MNPLRVLLVSYSFPPAGGVGVLRAASLARYLPGEGIQLDVLTTRNASAVGVDPTLLEDIPSGVTIHRTFTLDLPFGLKKWIKRHIGQFQTREETRPAKTKTVKRGFLKRVLQDVLLPDPQVTWLPILVPSARRIIRERSIDLVLVTVPPFSAALLVERLRKNCPNLPIVVDFRDEWLSTAIDLVAFSRSKRARSIARTTEAAAVKNATAVVAVTEAARKEIRSRYPQEPDSKFHIIANGFDVKSLRLVNSEPQPRPSGEIVVSHIGTVYASTDPGPLIAALQLLPPETKNRFKLRFIGHIEEPRFREELLRLGNIVELTGYLPQHQALAEMNDTDYVLLIQHGHLSVASKFYDYIGAGKPILAVVHPDGEERRLLEELGGGWWAASRDVTHIRQLFLDAANQFDSGNYEFKPNKEKIARYERRLLARSYARLLLAIGGRTGIEEFQGIHPEPVSTI